MRLFAAARRHLNLVLTEGFAQILCINRYENLSLPHDLEPLLAYQALVHFFGELPAH